MDNKSLLNGLIELGMSQREAKVYIALLSKKGASLSDLQKLSGVRQNKLSEVMNNLVRMGYCTEQRVGNRRFFDPLDPRSSLQAPLNKLESRLNKGRKLTDSLVQLYAISDSTAEPLEYIKTFHGNENIHRHFCDLVSKAKEEILVFVRSPFACYDKRRTDEQIEEYLSFTKRDGTLLMIYDFSSIERFDIAHNVVVLESIEKSGLQIRIINNLPLKMMVFDGREVLVAQEDLLTMSGELLMASIRQDAIAEAFRALFAFFWNYALDIETWKKKGIDAYKNQSYPLPDLRKSYIETRNGIANK